VEEYFDVLPMEKLLIEDTNTVVIPSVRPTRARLLVPTIMPVKSAQLDAYRDRVCEMLNGWAKRGRFAVRGQVHAAPSLLASAWRFRKSRPCRCLGTHAQYERRPPENAGPLK
jgi:hypothetical protein